MTCCAVLLLLVAMKTSPARALTVVLFTVASCAPPDIDVSAEAIQSAPGGAGTRRVVATAAGAYHSCAIGTDGQVRCWGYNGYGELGDGTTTSHVTPTLVTGLPQRAIAVTAGLFHSCALLVDGAVWCWGYNASGQLGVAAGAMTAVPVPVINLPTMTQVVAGANHSCALSPAGAVWCWGDNAAGQLGDGTVVSRAAPRPTSLAGAVQVASGMWHTCAISALGRVACWGRNYAGQVGNGTVVDQPSPTLVAGVTDAKDLGAGVAHTCALTAAGTLRCWGDNAYGQLGNGTLTGATTAITPPGDGVRTLAVGGYHTCAVTSAGRVRCAGANVSGELGDGGTTSSSTFVATAFRDVLTAHAGAWHTCAATAGGALSCVGDNTWGQLGDGSLTRRLAPSLAGVTVTRAPSIASGPWHTCAVLASGYAHCFGSNTSSQLGLPSVASGVTVTVPTASVAVGGDIAQVVALNHTTCLLRVSGVVECFGVGNGGQLGDGTLTESRATPTRVLLTRPAVAIAAGLAHVCALLDHGRVSCWGANDSGQLGDGSGVTHASPVAVVTPSNAALTRMVDLSANSGDFTCARRGDGVPFCWGSNGAGQCGVPTTTAPATRAVPVPGVFSATLSTGATHACATRGDGVTVCWGENDLGAYGSGSITLGFGPWPVTSLLDGGGALSAGNSLTCALSARGTVSCAGWGAGGSADGTAIHLVASPTPVDRTGSALAVALRAGHSANCHVTADNALWCWGANYLGQLGRGGISSWEYGVAPTMPFTWAP